VSFAAVIDTRPTSGESLNDATLRLLYPRLRRFAAVVAPAEVGPDDLVQEALEKLLSRESPHVVHLEAYLRQTMLHAASNHRRGLGRWRRALTRVGQSQQQQDVKAENSFDLELLEILAPRARAVLFLHEVEGFEFSEIAQQLGISQAAAKQTASRARRQLRQYIEQESQS
jgi:RNA polymerase sigma factor (sigma-70 family)